MREDNERPIVRDRIVILDPDGLHLRVASRFVGLARQFASEVRVYRENQQLDGKSILELAMLAAECGTQLDLATCGTDAEQTFNELAELVSHRSRGGG